MIERGYYELTLEDLSKIISKIEEASKSNFEIIFQKDEEGDQYFGYLNTSTYGNTLNISTRNDDFFQYVRCLIVIEVGYISSELIHNFSLKFPTYSITKARGGRRIVVFRDILTSYGVSEQLLFMELYLFIDHIVHELIPYLKSNGVASD